MTQNESSRARRVAEQIRHEIADLLANGVKDPRIGFVSVMGVRMSPDLRVASVYVSLLGEEKEKKGSMVGLGQSTGWIRRELGQRLRLRFTPEVRFFEDNSLDRVFHLDELFKELHEDGDESGDPGTPGDGAGDTRPE